MVLIEACTDRLDALLNRFPVRARLFHSGALCGATEFSAPAESGQMHLIRAGAVKVIHPGQAALEIEVPSLLFYPRPLGRCFITDAERGADLACADLRFEGGRDNPIVAALPDVVCLPLAQIDGADQVLALLFEEAFSDNCGRHAMVDRLFEVVLIQMLRHLMETDQVKGGMLAGMAHGKLRKALVAMHEQPATEWTLDALADIAGMSRSVFAATFRDVVGCTAGNYLQTWPVGLARPAVRQGQ